MGWSCGYENGRDVGYGVPSVCDHPDCNEEIDRGLSYKCESCGLFFCENHLTVNDDCEQVCFNCDSGYSPFPPKADTTEWINHKLTHESWDKWRSDNQEWVKNNSSNFCGGKNCKSIDGTGHSVECMFEHFLSYSGLWNHPNIDIIKNAYNDGYLAGKAQ